MAIETKDGYVVDEVTGEIIRHTDITDDTWVPKTREEVDWVLSLFAETDAERAKVELLLKARMENLKKQLGWFQRRHNFLERRFKDAVQEYAENVLSHDGKYTDGRDWPQKTLQLENGAIAFRFPTDKARPKIIISDEEEALDWCRENCPEAIKTKMTVLVSALQGKVNDLDPFAFELEWPIATCRIETGVGKTKEGKEGEAE